LSHALQTGVPTGSQKPQGCCGRLMLGREWKRIRATFARVNFPFQKTWDAPQHP
jgi:hypothetical protein